MDAMTTMTSGTTAFGQDNVQAFIESGQIRMTERQTTGQAVATATQKTLMHTPIENAVASTAKITGAAMTLVQDRIAPTTECMTGPTGAKAL